MNLSRAQLSCQESWKLTWVSLWCCSLWHWYIWLITPHPFPRNMFHTTVCVHIDVSCDVHDAVNKRDMKRMLLSVSWDPRGQTTLDLSFLVKLTNWYLVSRVKILIFSCVNYMNWKLWEKKDTPHSLLPASLSPPPPNLLFPQDIVEWIKLVWWENLLS